MKIGQKPLKQICKLVFQQNIDRYSVIVTLREWLAQLKT